MKTPLLRTILPVIMLVGGCASFQNPAKHQLADGYYRMKLDGKAVQVYLEEDADTIVVTQLESHESFRLPMEAPQIPIAAVKLSRPMLDIDLIGAIFKFRAGQSALPAQLNTQFNGNLYLGYRKDWYSVSYAKFFQNARRQIDHFGISVGVFSGLGSTPVNPSVTRNMVSSEYDGVISQNGAAAILAVNKITIGLGLGFDTLLDRNGRLWIYKGRPWLGLMVGLNLN